jgi:YidC/Oxa1 family membrane protein insertase
MKSRTTDPSQEIHKNWKLKVKLDQDKRLMLAFGLSLIILIFYRMYFVKDLPSEPKKAEQTTSAPQSAQTTATPVAASTTAAAPAPAALPVTQGAKAQEIVVEGDRYRVTFSTVGAVAESWMLKGYPKGENIEIINGPACKSLGFPLSLSVADPTLSSQLNQAVYVAKAYPVKPVSTEEEPAELTGNTFTPPVTLEFTYSDGKIQVKKEFSFDKRYPVKSSVSVFDGQHYLPVEVAWPGGFGDQSIPAAMESIVQRAAYESADEGKVREVTLNPSFLGRFFSSGSAPITDQVVPGPLVFAGMEDRFFTGIFLPNHPDTTARIRRQTWTPDDWHGDEEHKPKPLNVSIASNGAKPLDFRLFVAPKDVDVLRAMNPPLENMVDFGWFSVIAKPLFICLHYVNDHWTHNYGWAIVLLTVIITTATFPLKLKSLRSAQEMQKVAPIIKGIQDKYKNYKLNDPRKQKANEEIMKVYSEHGINPLGGCLPMALQLPILYAFYRVLDNVIELRHAPWIFWVKDLAAPDKLQILGYSVPVLVILMTIASFLLQRMTPMATADPSQARMMMFMPIFMGFIFYRFASGLVLYWLTSSVVQILQQVIINRRMPRTAALAPVPRK